MKNLNWREVAELRLAAPLVPNPYSTSELLDRLNHVKVAIEDGLLHIDPRPTTDQIDRGAEYDVTVMPTSAVEYIRYRVVAAQPEFVIFD